VFGEHNGCLEFPKQRSEGWSTETVMPHLDDMAELPAVMALRQQLQKTPEIRSVEFLGRCELP
jgi:hypothetical protein